MTQLKFDIIGNDQNASAAFRKVSNAADDTHQHMTKLSTVMGGVFGGELLFQGAEKAVDFLKESVDAAAEDQRADELLTNTLHNVAHATDEQTEAVKRRLLADGEHLGIMQDQMMPAFQKLLLVTHSTKAATDDLTLTEDVAAAKHIDLATAAGIVGKMTMGNAKAFKDFGLTVTSVTTAQHAFSKAQQNLASVQAQVNSGQLTGVKAANALQKAHDALTKAQVNLKDASDSQRDAMKKVADMTAGDAEKAADTYGGRLAQMHVRFHDLQVEIGNAVMPKLTQLMGFITDKAVPAFQSMAGFVKQNSDWLLPLIGGILAAAAAFKVGTAAVAAFNIVMDANPVLLIITGLVALVAALVVAYNKVTWFRDGVNAVFTTIGSVASAVWDGIKTAWDVMVDAIRGTTGAVKAVFDTIVGAVKLIWDGFWGLLKFEWDGVVAVWQGTTGAVKAVFNGIAGAVSSIFGGLWGGIQAGWNSVVSFFQNAGATVWKIFNNIGAAIASVFSNAWNGVGQAFKTVINWIIGKMNQVIGGASKIVSVLSLGNANIPTIPYLARGGVVMPRAGGVPAVLAEAGQPEAVMPLSTLSQFIGGSGGGNTTITVNVSSLPGNEAATAREIKRLLAQAARTSGNTSAQAIFAGAW